ncbi:MAG: hypothetical protein HXY43_13640 [Fischerella sp.]|nr:hypothetical protein [Fischerella sp.]NWF60268.1 hypothetical protein [Fischerella sp.]
MSYKTSIYKSVDNQLESAVKEIVERIIKSGKMSRQDHKLLTSNIHPNGYLNDAERRQINRILDYIQTGRLQLIDW